MLILGKFDGIMIPIHVNINSDHYRKRDGSLNTKKVVDAANIRLSKFLKMPEERAFKTVGNKEGVYIYPKHKATSLSNNYKRTRFFQRKSVSWKFVEAEYAPMMLGAVKGVKLGVQSRISFWNEALYVLKDREYKKDVDLRKYIKQLEDDIRFEREVWYVMENYKVTEQRARRIASDERERRSVYAVYEDVDVSEDDDIFDIDDEW